MNDFKIEKVLGKGSFGSVYLVTRKEDQKIYALKSVIMEKLNKKEQENSVNEVRILASVNHPNVIGYKEAFWDDKNNTLNIVMEYADDGDLQTKIQKMKKNFGFFEENLIWSYAIQMIEGLKALHDKKIMHRDLKSANIFLVKNKKQCKIGDMNVSKVIKEKVLTTQTGTPYYASPEVWNDKPYSYKSDLWSIGCVIYELCALRPPFKGKDLDELYINVCKGKVERINKIYSDNLWKMIMMLLQVDVNKRVNCEQFLNHPLIIKKIKEMKEKNIDYKDLEDNKNISDGCLLKTINFKDLRDIKAQLPTRKNYEDNKKNNINNNNLDNYFLFGNKKYEFDKNYSEYYKYLNNNINNILNNNYNNSDNVCNSNHIFDYNKNLLKNGKNKNDYIKKDNKTNNNILNIINNPNINKYNELLNKIKKQYNSNNNNIQKTNLLNDSSNSNINHNHNYNNYNNYNNIYDQIFHTDTGEGISISDKLSLLRNERDKNCVHSEFGLNCKKMDTEEKVMYNDKILQLKKEKNKILKKQKDNYSKTIEQQNKYYNNLLKQLNYIEPDDIKYSYLNKNNNYNINKNNNLNLSNIEKELKNKELKLEDKYKLLNYVKNNQIIKDKNENISTSEHFLKVDNYKNNKNIKHSSSSRLNVDFFDYNLPKTEVNNNIINQKYNEIKSSSRPLLSKKHLNNNNLERSKTPSLNYNKLSSNNIKYKDKDKDKDNDKFITCNSNYENIKNFKSLLNQISTDHIYHLSSLENPHYLDNLQNNKSSYDNSQKSNNIKRINKRVVTNNKKKKKFNKYNNNTNIIKNKHLSNIPTKRITKNITINNNLNLYDISNTSHQLSNHRMNDMNYDFNKYFNDINLTNINKNENYIKKTKTNMNGKPKISIDKHINNIPNRYSTDNITINKRYSIKSNNNNKINIKKNDHKSNNSFNFTKPPITSNKNYTLLKNAKKLNVRSNSYRISGHEQKYINKKRELDHYKYDLTEPEPEISNNLRINSNNNNIPKFGNLSLFSNDLDLLGISNNSNGKTFLQNIKANEGYNHLTNINKNNKLSGRYYLNIQNNESKCPQIFNNYYSFNGVNSSNLPIKVINVFNNK